MNARKVLGFALGPVATAVISLVAVPVLAWTFTPEDVARYNLLQLFVSFAVLFVTLGLDQAYVRQFHESPDRSVLLRSSVLPSAVVLVVLAVPAAAASGPLAELLFGTSDGSVFPVALGCATAAILSRFLSLILRMEERAIAFSLSQLIPKVVFLVGIAALGLLAVDRDFLNLSYAFLASWLTVVLVTGWSTRAQWRGALRARADVQLVRTLMRYSVPLVFAGVAYWALTATSAVALRYLSTLGELGVYSVALTFAGAAVVVQTVFSVVWAPVVYRWVADGSDLDRIDSVVEQVLAVVVALLVLCGVFSWAVELVLPPAYDGVKYLVLGSMLQPLLYTLSEVTGIGVNITRRTMWSLWCTVAALGVNVALNLALTPHFGAKGAVVANTLSYFAFLVARTEASARTWRPFPRLRLYVVMAGAVVAALATIIWGPGTGNGYALAWLVVAAPVGWAFREQWRSLIARRAHLSPPGETPRSVV